MPLDPSISLQGIPAQIEPQGNQLMRAMQMQGMMQNNALAGMQAQDIHAQRALALADKKKEAQRLEYFIKQILPTLRPQGQPAQPAIQGNNPSGDVPAQASTVDPRMDAVYKLGEAGLLSPKETISQLTPEVKLTGYKPGDQVRDQFGGLRFQVPEKAEKPEKPPGAVQEYQFSQSQGYKGSFDEWKKANARAGANNQVTNVNAYTPASEEAQKDFTKGIRGRYDQLQAAPVALQNIEEAKKLIPGAKGFMGPAGESLLNATKFLNNRVGMRIDVAGVKDAEELRTRVFMTIMDNLKKMDSQPSQMQQVMMRDALGSLGTDPAALSRVLDVMGKTIRGKVEIHNQEVKDSVGRGVKYPYNPVINLPEDTVGANTSGQGGETWVYDAQGKRVK